MNHESEKFDQPEPGAFEKSGSEKIERADIAAAFRFLNKLYHEELEKGDEVTQEIIEDNLLHTQQVAENAKWIARGEKLDADKLEMAAILHDCAKVRHGFESGIDTYEHHQRGSELTFSFLKNELEKEPALAREIASMILRHSYIPFIAKKVKVPQPQTSEDFALRDADVLDQIDIWGFRKVVRIRQNPATAFYQEDGGSLRKSIASVLQSAEEAFKLLRTSTARKIGLAYKKRLGKLLERLREENTQNLQEFEKIFDKFAKELTDGVK